MGMEIYALGLGSNRWHGRYRDPRRVVAATLAALADAGVEVTAVSRTIDTLPLGPGSRRFANAVALVRTALPPPEMLALAKRIERDFGRRRGRRWGDRVIDIDLLLWTGGRWRSPALRIPHPGMPLRSFVLRPLVELMPRTRPMLARLVKRRPA
jgi:2-amino-4-hydroxy-6-hydroxymethyldihydropteridine diphosphokinase